jgi:hypothetical protein
MVTHTSRALLAAALLGSLASVSRADRLVTTDGRVIEVKKAREAGDNYELVFAAGTVVVPKKHVTSVEIEGDMSDYVPKDDKERDFLAKGFVRHQGKWLSKPAFEEALAKAAEARRKRLEELAKRSNFDNGWTLETKHFQWRSNTSPAVLQRYVDLLEAFYDLMDTRIGIKPSPSLARTKMQVNVFKRQKEMIQHAGDEDIDESVLGYFSSYEQSLNFFHDYKDPARSEVTALHECTHLLTYLVEPDYLPQIWINEGVADFFGSCNVSVNKGKTTLVPGRLEEDSILTVQQAIAEKKHVPLDTLMLKDREEYDGFHYAHGWSLVYFLQNSPKYAKPFNKLFKDLYGLDLKEAKEEILNAGDDDKSGLRKRYQPADVRDALVKRLGVKDLATLEKEWLEYVGAVQIEGPRARFLRGYSTVFSGGDLKQARADLEAALAGGYVTPDVHWALGYTRLLGGDGKEAVLEFRKSVELDPLDAVYRADLAWGLTGWWGPDSGKLDAPKEVQDEALLLFGLAAELDPENDEFAELARGFAEIRAGK